MHNSTHTHTDTHTHTHTYFNLYVNFCVHRRIKYGLSDGLHFPFKRDQVSLEPWAFLSSFIYVAYACVCVYVCVYRCVSVRAWTCACVCAHTCMVARDLCWVSSVITLHFIFLLLRQCLSLSLVLTVSSMLADQGSLENLCPHVPRLTGMDYHACILCSCWVWRFELEMPPHSLGHFYTWFPD